MEDKEIVERVVKLETKSKQHDKDIDKLQGQNEAIYKIATSVELLAKESTITNEKIEQLDIKIDKVDAKVGKMDETIEEIKCKPDKAIVKKYNEIVKYIILFILGAGLTIIAQKIGLV